ncbi:MAG: spore germination protein [Clostridia bacterium]|nr:spore germination protein [Clostridia bacterium]
MFLSCQENIEYFRKRLNDNIDVLSKVLNKGNKSIAIIYIKSIINDQLLTDMILLPLTKNINEISVDYIKKNIITTASIEKIENSETADDEIIAGMLAGKVALFVDGEDSCILIDIEEVPIRMPTEPPTSAVLYGPRVGFTENAKKNISMLRKRLPTDKLVLKEFEIGKYTKTMVVLCYLKDIIKPEIVKDISKKLQNINIDGVIDTHYILSFLQKGQTSFFKQAGIAEKPDIVSAKMLEGRAAIIVEGSPVVLTIPFMIFEDIQNSNDYYTNPIYTSFIRIIRIMGILAAVISPGLYLSFRLFHHNILPLRFLITISNSTEGLPFTPFIELIFILILFQILYEVSLRLPRYLGLATSIVGALILGQTGVNAGLISPPGVIIIAMSIITIYIVPDETAQLTILRAIFLIIGGTIGILGIIGGMIYIINELATMQNYGTPYLTPYAPRTVKDLKDGVFMQPIYKMTTRPKSLIDKNEVRIKDE